MRLRNRKKRPQNLWSGTLSFDRQRGLIFCFKTVGFETNFHYGNNIGFFCKFSTFINTPQAISKVLDTENV